MLSYGYQKTNYPDFTYARRMRNCKKEECPPGSSNDKKDAIESRRNGAWRHSNWNYSPKGGRKERIGCGGRGKAPVKKLQGRD